MKKMILSLSILITFPAMAFDFNCQSSNKDKVVVTSTRAGEVVTVNGLQYTGKVRSMYTVKGDASHKYDLQDSTGNKASLVISVKEFESHIGNCRARVCNPRISYFITGKFLSSGLNLDLSCI